MRLKPNKYFLEPQIYTFTITKILGKRVIFERSFFHITTTLIAKTIGNRAMTILS